MLTVGQITKETVVCSYWLCTLMCSLKDKTNLKVSLCKNKTKQRKNLLQNCRKNVHKLSHSSACTLVCRGLRYRGMGGNCIRLFTPVILRCLRGLCYIYMYTPRTQLHVIVWCILDCRFLQGLCYKTGCTPSFIE